MNQVFHNDKHKFQSCLSCRQLLTNLSCSPCKRHLLKPIYEESSPETINGLIGQTMFWWLNPLLRRGYSISISIDDLMTLDDQFTITTPSEKNGLYLEWEKASRTHTTHALLFASIRYYKWPILAGIFPRLAQIGFFFAQPYLVGTFVTFVSTEITSKHDGYGLIGAFALVYTGLAVSFYCLVLNDSWIIKDFDSYGPT